MVKAVTPWSVIHKPETATFQITMARKRSTGRAVPAVARRTRRCYPPATHERRSFGGALQLNLKEPEMAEDEGGIDPSIIDTSALDDANGAGQQVQIGVLVQYVKDFSFENPNAPAVYQWQGQPQMDVQVNIGVNGVGQDVHEVVLKIEVEAKSNEGVAFRCEALYAGLFALRNIPEEQLQPFLLAEAPRLL